jgi:hypothetical protein
MSYDIIVDYFLGILNWLGGAWECTSHSLQSWSLRVDGWSFVDDLGNLMYVYGGGPNSDPVPDVVWVRGEMGMAFDIKNHESVVKAFRWALSSFTCYQGVYRG